MMPECSKQLIYHMVVKLLRLGAVFSVRVAIFHRHGITVMKSPPAFLCDFLTVL